VEGRLTEAEQWADRAFAGAEVVGLAGNPVMEGALRAQGRIAYERGDLAAAERLLEQSILSCEEVRPAFLLVSELALARVWFSAGRVGDALAGVDHAREFLPPDSTSPLLELCDALKGRIALELGDLEGAEECAHRIGPGRRACVLRTRAKIARGEFDRARDELAQCEPRTLRERLDTAVLAARIAHGATSDDADELLAVAVETAKTEGFVVAITDDMAELGPRLTLLLRSGRIGDYETAVLDRLENGLPVTKANAAAGPLSDREQTVLRYLASRMTNQEIATEIFVSTNTLKTHVKRIYRKLGVSSRTEAITEARRLGVL
jgi:LuxR family maltose regulon positive regulatory protein